MAGLKVEHQFNGIIFTTGEIPLPHTCNSIRRKFADDRVFQFFGYGESYTLVTAAVALYVLSGFRCLRGEASILSPTLLLGFCAALHLLSLSLLPSWLYLLWHDGGKLGQLLRRPGVYAPLMAGAAVVCVYACVEFYLQLSLPLWQADENGKYAILARVLLTSAGSRDWLQPVPVH